MGLGVHSRVLFGIEDDLGKALSVAQVNKNNAAMVPPALYPAHQDDLFSDIFGAQFTAVVGPSHFSKHVRQWCDSLSVSNYVFRSFKLV